MSLPFEDSAAEEQAHKDYTGFSEILPLPALCIPSLPQGMSAQRAWKALKGKPEQRSVKMMQIMRAKGIYLGPPQTHNGLGFFGFFFVVAVICKCSYLMKCSGRGCIALTFRIIPHSVFHKVVSNRREK